VSENALTGLVLTVVGVTGLLGFDWSGLNLLFGLVLIIVGAK
jgi:hypothetical protein